MFKNKNKDTYKIFINNNDSVFVPSARDTYRKATVINQQYKDDKLYLRIRFDSTATEHFINSDLCYKVIGGIIIPLRKPVTKKEKFCVWIVRKFGLVEVGHILN